MVVINVVKVGCGVQSNLSNKVYNRLSKGSFIANPNENVQMISNCPSPVRPLLSNSSRHMPFIPARLPHS
jgi:hypothetical protein